MGWYVFFGKLHTNCESMPTAAQPDLVPGRVYRTHDLARWGANPTRLAKRLLLEGRLRQLGQGLFFAPKRSRFGPTPPVEEEILRGLLKTRDFVITGPPLWNALGLGTTAMFVAALVYNHRRTGEFTLGNLRFQLRRVRYPERPTPEWFAIDLLENHEAAGAGLGQLEVALRRALSEGRFDGERLRMMANEYATLAIRQLIARCIEGSVH